MTTQLTNTYISKFEEKLKIFNNTFLKTVNGHGVLLTELSDIKTNVNLNIPPPAVAGNAVANAAADAANISYNTAQFAGFIKNIINFKINNFDNLPTINNNMNYVVKSTVNGANVYTFNNNVKKNIIETLKVINVFVDILEAYKNCIDDRIPLTGYTSGYTNEIKIDRIELVSDTTRFYNNGYMFPQAKYKNVGYIRSINEIDSGPMITVLYLSIESFYTGMIDANNIYYEHLFTKDKIDKLSPNGIIIEQQILGPNALLNTTLVETLEITNYSRQIYSGIEDADIKTDNITLIQRNKNLIIYLLKTLFTLEPNFRKQSVNALYYYYKFIQLYSTFIINLSNVMYADVRSPNNPQRIETLNMTSVNIAVPTISRVISGIEIKTAGAKRYTQKSINPIVFQGGGGLGADMTVPSNGSKNIPIDSTITINSRGKGYINKPSASVPGTFTSNANDASNVAFNTTIVPIPTVENLNNQNYNLVNLGKIVVDISNSLTIINSELSNSSTNESFSSIIGITTIPTDANASTISFSKDDNYAIITVKKSSIVTKLINLMDKEDIINNYIIYDVINKHYYSILKIIKVDNFIKLKMNAVILEEHMNFEDNIDTKIFRNIYNQYIDFSDTDDFENIKNYESSEPISSEDNNGFLQIKKKDLNAYKNEYIYNRDDIARLDENIKRNINIIEHNKNLYDAQYNKNLFLTRQIISYNTIIAVIIIILIFINLLNFDKLFIKTVSLICLGIVLLLFAVYFISNITYIESFVDVSMIQGYSFPETEQVLTNKDNFFYQLTKEYINNRNPSTGGKVVEPSISEHNNIKYDILNAVTLTLNAKFISFFEKLIITLPINDNVDFYKEVKGIITNDKNSKVYSNNVLLFNKDETINNTGTIKYEIENNKLYLMSLLIATIIFITIYNLYINYVSDSRFLSLTVFICIIILFIVASYYVIRTNRRVRTFYKNIYWGPESSIRF